MAAVSIFLIVALCFNALPPNFTYQRLVVAGGSGSSDGSIFNQIFWVGILLLSIPAVVSTMRSSASGVYVKAMPLLALGVLLVVSSLWSLAPGISLRRSMLELIVIASVLANVVALQRAEQAFVILYRVAFMTLAFELVMLLRANGFDLDGYFRGIHTQKNVLGLVAAISILAGIWVRSSGFLKSRICNSAFLLGWLVVLVLSHSKTSLALVLVAPALAFALRKSARGLGTGVGIPLLAIFGLAYSALAVAYISGVDIGGNIGHWVHQVRFTGRDQIWQFLIARYLERPWLGYGYGGFWDVGPLSPNQRYGTGFIPLLNQAHNGYLDVLLAVGVTGMIVCICVFVGYLACLSRAENRSRRGVLALCWTFVVFALLHNLTESSLLRGFLLVWVIQLIAMAVTYRMAHEAGGPVDGG